MANPNAKESPDLYGGRTDSEAFLEMLLRSDARVVRTRDFFKAEKYPSNRIKFFLYVDFLDPGNYWGHGLSQEEVTIARFIKMKLARKAGRYIPCCFWLKMFHLLPPWYKEQGIIGDDQFYVNDWIARPFGMECMPERRRG